MLIEPPDLPDFSTKAGAQELAATIRNYWRGRGATVTVETFVVMAEGRNYGIRSNLVNGLPRRGRPPGAAKRVLRPRVQKVA
jgi:hypothetical protein